MLLLGIGNLVPRSKHFSVSFEIGAAYQGPPRVTLNLSGSACDSNRLVLPIHQLRSDDSEQHCSGAGEAQQERIPYKFLSGPIIRRWIQISKSSTILLSVLLVRPAGVESRKPRYLFLAFPQEVA